MLIIAIMATDNLSDTDDRVRLLADGRPDPSTLKESGCDFAGARTFAGALEAILAEDEIAKRVQSVTVSRLNMSAHVWYRPAKRKSSVAVAFGPDLARDFDVTSHVSGVMLRYLGEQLRDDTSRNGGART